MEIIELEHKLSKLLEWDKWVKEVPFIPFPKKWEVQIVPPSLGAIVRFRVKLKEHHDDHRDISVYLDCYDLLGSFGEPYWEIYPNKEGDCSRIPMNNITKLLRELKDALKHLYEEQ